MTQKPNAKWLAWAAEEAAGERDIAAREDFEDDRAARDFDRSYNDMLNGAA